MLRGYVWVLCDNPTLKVKTLTQHVFEFTATDAGYSDVNCLQPPHHSHVLRRKLALIRSRHESVNKLLKQYFVRNHRFHHPSKGKHPAFAVLSITSLMLDEYPLFLVWFKSYFYHYCSHFPLQYKLPPYSTFPQLHALHFGTACGTYINVLMLTKYSWSMPKPYESSLPISLVPRGLVYSDTTATGYAAIRHWNIAVIEFYDCREVWVRRLMLIQDFCGP